MGSTSSNAVIPLEVETEQPPAEGDYQNNRQTKDHTHAPKSAKLSSQGREMSIMPRVHGSPLSPTPPCRADRLPRWRTGRLRERHAGRIFLEALDLPERVGSF